MNFFWKRKSPAVRKVFEPSLVPTNFEPTLKDLAKIAAQPVVTMNYVQDQGAFREIIEICEQTHRGTVRAHAALSRIKMIAQRQVWKP